jgi:hypothetical protein
MERETLPDNVGGELLEVNSPANSAYLEEFAALYDPAPEAAPTTRPVGRAEVGLLQIPRRKRMLSRKLKVRELTSQELGEAKQSFVTRRASQECMKTLICGPIRPRTGDLVLARVARIHYQRRIELINGRKAMLQPGGAVILAYGDRYATDQFEAEVPLDLGTTNLVATGGVASRMISRTSGLRPATVIDPIGLIGGADGNPLNLEDFASAVKPMPAQRPLVVAVLGTSMNSGKTTTNHSLIMGLRRTGLRTAAAKITGTGSGGDYWSMVDAGAHFVADFTDAGYSATYKLSLPQIEGILRDLIAQAAHSGAEIILIEIADGIFQEQNTELIRSPVFRSLVDKIIFAAGEALGAAMGTRILQEIGIPLIGVSGKLTASSLLIREFAAVSPIPIYTRDELSDPTRVRQILGIPQSGPVPTTNMAVFPDEDAAPVLCKADNVEYLALRNRA